MPDPNQSQFKAPSPLRFAGALQILRFDSIDSTNIEAMRQAKAGAPEGTHATEADAVAGSPLAAETKPATPPMQGANAAGFKSWISESRKVEPLTGDKDVFGDGSVIVLRMPGHTPGHSGLLVRLKEMGPVLLTGDLVHFRENYESGGVPSFNFDRAATVASIERMKQIVANLKATVVIQHDMRDIAKLPAFPAAAK